MSSLTLYSLTWIFQGSRYFQDRCYIGCSGILFVVESKFSLLWLITSLRASASKLQNATEFKIKLISQRSRR